MPKCMINDQEIEFSPGENLIQVAKKGGISIPFFCYHPGLSIVAQCRMCLVEVQKMPKLQTACSTPAVEGMVVYTRSSRVLEAQKSTMEFLLINHPLDCPVCDKSGECDLQNNSFDHGSAYSRYTEERRTYLDLDMGPVIQKNMNRCIHCTRCIRFGEEIAGIHEMVALKRGNYTEISTIDGMPLKTEYAGNYADFCPTGSLTLKDFRFKKRAWMLKKTATICEGCSRGCHMEIQHEGNRIYRCIPRENLSINRYWLCDEGRFNYHYVQSEERIVQPVQKGEHGFQECSWNSAIDAVRKLVLGKKIGVLVGSDLTQEEVVVLQEFMALELPGAESFHFGTPGILSSQEDADADAILKRKSKTANLHGLERLGFRGWSQFSKAIEGVIVFSGGRAVLPDWGALPSVGVGVFQSSQTLPFQVILPGVAFSEKEGSIVNWRGDVQKMQRALVPPRSCKPLSEILMIWANQRMESGVA